MNDYVFSLGSDHESGIGASITVRAGTRVDAMRAVVKLVASFNEYSIRTEHGVVTLFTDGSQVQLIEGPPGAHAFELEWSSGGYAVVEAENEQQARELFARQRPDADIRAVRALEAAHA
jgi:hypothetical protein